MAVKGFLTRVTGWVRSRFSSETADFQPSVDSDGLIAGPPETESADNSAIVKKVHSTDKSASIERLEVGFNKLIDQLQGINKHLSQQVNQHEGLMKQIDHFPKLLESFPSVVENQKQLTEQLLEQLKAASLKQQQFVEAVEKMPNETAKQTDALEQIDHQLAASADTDVQMVENFIKFNEAIDKLNQTAKGQRDSILQMSKTFAASDRYLKYLISRQNKRFMWIFMTAVGVCFAVILAMVGIIIYLKQ